MYLSAVTKPLAALLICGSALVANAQTASLTGREFISTDPITSVPARYIQINTTAMLVVNNMPSANGKDWTFQRTRNGKTTVISGSDIQMIVPRANAPVGKRYLITFVPSTDVLSKGDTLQVTTTGVPLEGVSPTASAEQFTLQSEIKVSDTISTFVGFQVTPGFSEAEKLLDGSATSVGQLTIKGTYLAPWDLQVSTNSLVSTNSDDVSSSLDLSIKKPFDLFPGFYPAFISAELTGNQIWTNASNNFKFGFGPIPLDMHGLVPPMITAVTDPTGAAQTTPSHEPDVQLSGEFLNWINRDPLVSNYHSEQDQFLVTGEFSWTPIFFGKMYPEVSADNPAVSTYKSFEITMDAQGFWFPNDQATGTATVRNFEGLFSLGLVVPLPNLFKGDFKVLWNTGANPTNNFVRSNSVSFSYVTSF